MDRILVRGSGPLRGEVAVSGSKNSALALMAAAMLALLVRQLRVALGPRAGRDEVSPAEERG